MKNNGLKNCLKTSNIKKKITTSNLKISESDF